MAQVVVLTGVAGLLMALVDGPARRLGLWLAAVTFPAFPLIFLIGPAAQFLAVAGVGVVTAACAPFTARRNRLRWHGAVALVQTALAAWLVVWDPALTALYVLLLAPGAVTAVVRFLGVRRRDEDRRDAGR
ncbi:hypothetical protein V1J52_16365 [Streptomyces sp. TRM 70351]|uniref:hypothetical protein n=1 Tax=Streptomyces sp. TRM 70351 TaxID=3116552 RepID=UPI002E7C1A28|nr:hypothetical protein [Streptomyces sp. TRM 70351]MEE1929741.1 hypothetical protein [Streptomyces sp. TRM 70351]